MSEDGDESAAATRLAEANSRVMKLIEILRSNETISDATRAEIADLLDPKSASEFQAKLGFRKRGKPSDPYIYSKEHYIGWAIAIQVEEGHKTEAAVALACAEYGVKRAYAFSAYRAYKEYWLASLDLIKSGNPRSLPLGWKPSRDKSGKKPD